MAAFCDSLPKLTIQSSPDVSLLFVAARFAITLIKFYPHNAFICFISFSQYNYTFSCRDCSTRWRSFLKHCAIRAGRSKVWFPMASFRFFTDLILAAALWPWDLFSFFFRGSKDGRCLGLTTLPLSCFIRENWEPQPSWSPRSISRSVKGHFTSSHAKIKWMIFVNIAVHFHYLAIYLSLTL